MTAMIHDLYFILTNKFNLIWQASIRFNTIFLFDSGLLFLGHPVHHYYYYG